MNITWHEDTDIVIAGYGLAGAVAAIVAHDLGSRTLIIEKAAYPGGCSILAGGAIKCLHDAEAGAEYLAAISGGRVDRELIQSFAQGLAENEGFVQRLAEDVGAKVKQMKTGPGVYPFPGRDALYQVAVVDIPGFSGFPWVAMGRSGGVMMFKVIMDNIEKRGIPVWMSTPVKQLIQDGSGAIIGVVAEKDGQEVNIKAHKAVILATGGFEQNQWLLEQYLQGKPFYSMAPVSMTGDGVLMAQKAGAALWHMWHIHGSYGFKFPEHPIAFRHRFSGHRRPDSKMPWIVVDRLGRRFMNECPPAPQDTPHRPMELYDPDLPGYPRIPSYMIFDEECRKTGPMAHPMAFTEHNYEWSKDNLAEIEKGWILKADSLEELAAKIRAMPENERLMDSARLVSTITGWNNQVQAGQDPLGRPSGTMMPIQSPPFYAGQVWPVITNTQGGPVHDAYQRVLDPFGQPIPRLYAVGELGSFFGHLYELGGNLGECFSSGRIAGKHTAALKTVE